MLRSRDLSLVFLIFCGMATESRAEKAAPQVVVLRNGNVLRGTIEQTGESVRVISAGSEVHLRAGEVDLRCGSLHEAYRQLRGRITPDTAVGHLQLAAWCIRQELWAEAQRELEAARRLEPSHPRLVLLEQTAEHLQKLAQSEPVPVAPSAQEGTERRKPSASDPQAEQLGELPEGALEDFTRRIQPILVNNCTTSGCHREGGPQSFQLNRNLLHGMANRRSTLRNLAATLRVVNVAAPLDSDLLQRASMAHGGTDVPPFPLHQPELRERLEEWMLLVSGKDPPETVPSNGTIQLAGGVANGAGGVVPAGGIVPPSDGQSTIAADPETDVLLAPVQSKPPRVGVQLRAWAPRDEFDPEIFNRMQMPTGEDATLDAPNE